MMICAKRATFGKRSSISVITGAISEDIENSMRFYSICSRQYSLTFRKQAFFLIHVFGGPELRFFLDNCFDHGNMSYHEMITVMFREYSSDTGRMKVKGTLETFCLPLFMAEHDTSDISTGFTKLADHINSLAPY